jgi:hypothetical protein
MWYVVICLFLATWEAQTGADKWAIGNKPGAYIQWALALSLVTFGIYYGVFVL